MSGKPAFLPGVVYNAAGPLTNGGHSKNTDQKIVPCGEYHSEPRIGGFVPLNRIFTLRLRSEFSVARSHFTSYCVPIWPDSRLILGRHVSAQISDWLQVGLQTAAETGGASVARGPRSAPACRWLWGRNAAAGSGQETGCVRRGKRRRNPTAGEGNKPHESSSSPLPRLKRRPVPA